MSNSRAKGLIGIHENVTSIAKTLEFDSQCWGLQRWTTRYSRHTAAPLSIIVISGLVQVMSLERPIAHGMYLGDISLDVSPPRH
jgi:hypothetical protein